jgi:signal transduction histidine kinase
LSGTKNREFPAIGSHLKMMYHTSLVTSQTLESEALLQQILKRIAEWVPINQGCIWLYDSDLRQLIPKTPCYFPDDQSFEESSRLVIDRSVLEYVMKRREGLLTTVQHPEHDQMICEILCVPMLGRYGLIGIIYIDTLYHSDPAPRLTPDHLSLLMAIAHQTALAIEDTRFYQGMIQAEHLAVLGQTVSTLSHHIKNILQGINGGSYLLRTGIDSQNDELIRRGWGIVEKNQKRISQLILDILTLSREREPSYELADLVETVTEAVELLRFRAKESGVEMTFKAETTIPKFFFDVEQIHRAMTNLITNGIDAAAVKTKDEVRDIAQGLAVDSGGDWEMKTFLSSLDHSNGNRQSGKLQIQMDYQPEKSIVLIRVDDNGSGIPESQRLNLFRAFYSQKKGHGTGLGLSVTSKIIREHGGEIRVIDSPLGGAGFEIELPVRFNEPVLSK